MQYTIEELQPLKYKIGDYVVISNNIIEGLVYDDDGKAFTFVTQSMKSHKGKYAKILRISNSPINRGYYLSIDNQMFVWHEKLLTKLKQNKYRIK